MKPALSYPVVANPAFRFIFRITSQFASQLLDTVVSHTNSTPERYDYKCYCLPASLILTGPSCTSFGTTSSCYKTQLLT